jgi:hypothetical protein
VRNEEQKPAVFFMHENDKRVWKILKQSNAVGGVAVVIIWFLISDAGLA